MPRGSRVSFRTTEVDPASTEVARANSRKANLAQVIDSRLNGAFEEIPRLEGDFALVFVDTGTLDNKRFLDLIGSRISRGGAVVAQNAGSLRWLQRGYWRALTDNPEWETATLGAVAVSWPAVREVAPSGLT
jgi:predicted O-methyltransferase YrrM